MACYVVVPERGRYLPTDRVYGGQCFDETHLDSARTYAALYPGQRVIAADLESPWDAHWLGFELDAIPDAED